MFSDGLGVVATYSDALRFGAVDQDGNVAIDLIYPALHPFRNGRALTMNEEGRYGYIDRNGHWLEDVTEDFAECDESIDQQSSSGEIPSGYDYAEPFHEGVAVVGIEIPE